MPFLSDKAIFKTLFPLRKNKSHFFLLLFYCKPRSTVHELDHCRQVNCCLGVDSQTKFRDVAVRAFNVAIAILTTLCNVLSRTS